MDRKEKILRHAQYVEWRLAGSPLPELVDWIPPGLDMHRELYLSKFPTARARSFNQLERDYGATFFIIALRRFISLANNPSLATERQLDTSLWNVHFPFRALPVWHMIKFRRTDPVTGQLSTADSIHVRPARHDKPKSHMLPGCFDTALINDGRGKDYGVKGRGGTGYRVGRIRVIFSIPDRYHHMLFKPHVLVPQHLAYVELFTKLGSPDPNHGMFKVSPWKDHNGGRVCSIIPVANIRRSVHLIPKFGPVAPPEWTTSNVLDICPTFFVNIYTDRHLFRTLFDVEAE
ncbi:hypothetical protein JOM56_009055 [Amanita muscaria]